MVLRYSAAVSIGKLWWIASTLAPVGLTEGSGGYSSLLNNNYRDMANSNGSDDVDKDDVGDVVGHVDDIVDVDVVV